MNEIKVTSFNVRGLNTPAKRHNTACLIKKYGTKILLLQETHYKGIRCFSLPDVYIDEDEHNLTNLSSNGTCSYIGFVSVTNPYLWDLWIKNETLFQERILCADADRRFRNPTFSNIQKKITSIYSKSTFLNYFFLAAKVNYNSTEEDKSVILHLDFAKPSKSMKYPISIELLEGLLRQNMYDLEKYERQDSHNLKESLQVTVISM
ncbi:TPA-induced transmembrane protein isoform X3 [Eleutherodactylus coqui]|uniref:TPA-induced transmembrane protein isoform X3 n=1 Tax=Eleutherodactylus coqui TaxID=57060 RepID=UPI00346266AF